MLARSYFNPIQAGGGVPTPITFLYDDGEPLVKIYFQKLHYVIRRNFRDIGAAHYKRYTREKKWGAH